MKLFHQSKGGHLICPVEIGEFITIKGWGQAEILEARRPGSVFPTGWVIMEGKGVRFGVRPERFGMRWALPIEYQKQPATLVYADGSALAGRRAVPGDCLGKRDGWHVWLEGWEPPCDTLPNGLVVVKVGGDLYGVEPEEVGLRFAQPAEGVSK